MWIITKSLVKLGLKMTKEEEQWPPSGFDAASLVGAEVFAPKKESSKTVTGSIESKLDEIMAGQKLLNEKIESLIGLIATKDSHRSW